MKRLVIFDLDGTLLDSVGGIASACNKMLDFYGFRKWELENYKHFIGNGTRKLIERALPSDKSKDDDFVEQAKNIYLRIYRENITQDTKPYDGITDLLRAIDHKGVLSAVASNKFDDGTKHLITHFFPEIEFVAVEGQKEGVPVKPDPRIVYDIIAQVGVQPDEVLYVGDTAVDMNTAANAKVESVGVTWGFRGREELENSGAIHIVDKPLEIISYL